MFNLLWQIFKKAWVRTLGIYATFTVVIAGIYFLFPDQFQETANMIPGRLSQIAAITFAITILLVMIVVTAWGLVKRKRRPVDRTGTGIDDMDISPAERNTRSTLNFGSIAIWAIMAVAIFLLGLVCVKLRQFSYVTTSEAIQGFLVGSLVLVTMFYAWETKNISESSRQSTMNIEQQAEATMEMAGETKKQRLDASRPLLVPVEGVAGVAQASLSVIYRNPKRLLHIRNIGLGPAINIYVRLEKPSDNSDSTQHTEILNSVAEPLSPGDYVQPRSWLDTVVWDKIEDNSTVAIYYDDIFGRHFRTKGRYNKHGNYWVDIKIEEVKERLTIPLEGEKST